MQRAGGGRDDARCTGRCAPTIGRRCDWLLRAGANANAANRYGVTPLSLAATNGNAAMIEALMKAGADANATPREGETVLMTAARTGKADAVKVLLAHGADPNASEAWLGETALMWAAAQNHAAAVAGARRPTAPTSTRGRRCRPSRR